MIHQIEIAGRVMKVKDTSDSEHRPSIGNDAPHAHWCMKRTDAFVELEAFKRVCQRVGKVKSVFEMFGGSGWHSNLIQKYCEPQRHMAVDINEDCVESIHMSLPLVDAIRADSYAFLKATNQEFTWIHADFNCFTFNKAEAVGKDGERYRRALRHIFKKSERFATITDSAIFGLKRFEKNRQSYGIKDWREYYGNAAGAFAEKWGYAVKHIVIWKWMAAMFLLEKDAEHGFEIEIVSEQIPHRRLA